MTKRVSGGTPTKARKAASTAPERQFSGYVVGIGASAGGLEALEKFFTHCAADTGSVFVVIQHLSPDHKSMMSNLLARHTRMPVVMVEEDMPIESDHVYLIPPGAIMHMTPGHLHLTPKNPRGLTLPIDIFFSSLAETYGNHAIGVVLSGTGSDGTRGASAIIAAGGFMLAQDPETAKFDGMPRSVIATGQVDAVLQAEELAERLLSHIQNKPYAVASETDDKALPPMPRLALSREEALAGILQLLLQIGEIDFQDYKPATIMRRIERRMQVRHALSLEAYLDLLESDRNEALTLRRELLIAVTSFFRDTDAYQTLGDKAVGSIIAGKQAGDTVRVWAAGVSTGEEAYSLGMLFLEAMEKVHQRVNLKIFATDVNAQNIESAGIGQYPESAAAELSPERLERFFTKRGNVFVVKNDLRQCIVFARHNLLTDPPFTKMDLVVCRNTLIYFKNNAQDRAIRRLQYAINPGGYLFLGSSESLSANAEGFVAIHQKHKLFKRTSAISPLLFESEGRTANARAVSGKKATPSANQKHQMESRIIEAGLAALLGTFTPPSILVNRSHEAIHLFGNVQPFLRLREGSASLDLNRILPDTLVPVASALLFKAAKDMTVLVSDLIHLTTSDGRQVFLRVSARPLALEAEERYLLLCFEQQSVEAGMPRPEPINIGVETMERVDVLERELMATRESLQATIEELETSNEELQATNEELMASNEELQSSNEELQSVNEELNTVNAEYQEKMMILNRVNADLDSMAKAAGVATIFVDSDMVLTRFSPDATQIFKLRASDVGRRLDDFAHSLDYPNLINDLESTLATQRMIEREVRASNGRTFLSRILPYSVPSSTAKGVVATFIDITALQDVAKLQSILDALPEHIAVLAEDGGIVLINQAWRRFAIANGDPQLVHSGPGSNYIEACKAGVGEDGKTSTSAVQGLKGVLEGSLPLFSLQYPCHSPTEKRWFVMNVSPVRGHGFGAVVSHVNISSWFTDAPEASREHG